MPWSTSGLFQPTWVDILDLTCSTLDWDATNMFKVALYDNTITPNFATTSEASRYAGTGSTFAAAGGQTGGPQVFHTGQWAQAGPVLVGNDITAVATNKVRFDANDISSGSAATMSNIHGCFIYADAVTTPASNADAGAVAVWFGGTAFSVTNGTFTIQWSANGIWELTVA